MPPLATTVLQMACNAEQKTTFAVCAFKGGLQGGDAGDQRVHSIDHGAPLVQPQARRQERRLELRLPASAQRKIVFSGRLFAAHHLPQPSLRKHVDVAQGKAVCILRWRAPNHKQQTFRGATAPFTVTLCSPGGYSRCQQHWPLPRSRHKTGRPFLAFLCGQVRVGCLHHGFPGNKQ